MKEQVKTPEQDPGKRIKNFEEVNLGYTKELAIEEASRCLQCEKPKCVDGCPVNINIPKFIKYIKEDKADKAIKTIKKMNNLPAVCGRVCPQENQCEKACILSAKGNPINIGKLERYAADNEGEAVIPNIENKKERVAVIGSGPGGLTCAADLALMGYKVAIFEALHKSGGVLTYGIPEFRLPKKIVEKEIEFIKKLGVEIKHDAIAGKLFSLDELLKKFDAVFIGTGAGLPKFMKIPGENLVNVYSANEFLTRVNLMKAYKFPEYKTPVKKAKKTVVVGGGNVAMDAARVAKRLDSDVTIVYRRSIDEMPARTEEIQHAKEEGINLLMLTNPVRILGEGKVSGIGCIQMMLGEPDESGRRRPMAIDDSEFIIECDQVIMAIGQAPNPLITKTSSLRHDSRGYIIVDENLMASMPGVFAGGDIIGGGEGSGATVIKAMADGKKAAKAIDAYIKNKAL